MIAYPKLDSVISRLASNFCRPATADHSPPSNESQAGVRLTRRFAAPLPSVAPRNLQAVMPIAEVIFL